MLLLLTGCIFVTPTELEDRLQNLPGTLRVQSLTPNWARTDSTAPIPLILTGGGFDDTTTLQIGGTEVNLSSYGETRLEGNLPVSSTPGNVEILLQRRLDAIELPLAQPFTWFSPNKGQTGLLASLSHTTYVGSYGQDHPATLDAWLVLSTASEADIQSYFAPTEGCITGPPPALDWTGLDTGPSTLNLAATASPLELTLETEGGGEFMATQTDTVDILGDWGISSIQSDLFPDIQAPSLFDMPEPLVLTSPLKNGITTMSRDAAWIYWVPLGAMDHVVVRLENENGEVLAACRTDDTGEFLIPSEFLVDWSSGDTRILKVGRQRIHQSQLPWNDATAATIAVGWMAGLLTMD